MPGAHREFATKTQRAFATHHQMGDDIEGVGVLHKGINVESRHIFDGIFILDSLHQFFVGKHFVANRFNSLDDFGMRFSELLAAFFTTGVENGAIGKHNAHGFHFHIAIGMGAAAHTRGIVHHDATHHSRIFGSRVGRENLAVGAENLVHSFVRLLFAQAVVPARKVTGRLRR